MIDKLNIYSNKLLDIDSESKKILLLLIPTIYCFWLYAIGQLICHNKMLKRIVSIVIILFNLILTIWLILLPILIIYKLNVIDRDKINSILTVLWILIGAFYSILTILFEKDNPHRHGVTNVSLFDYFVRFFIIVNWAIGIWSYQRIVNKYKIMK